MNVECALERQQQQPVAEEKGVLGRDLIGPTEFSRLA